MSTPKFEDSDTFLRETAAPLARAWIQECIASHESCQKEPRAATIFCTDSGHMIVDLKGGPSRVLEFTPDSDSSTLIDGCVRVVESSSLAPDIQYVALSHRWGANDLFKTTRENFSQMTGTGIRVGNLPRTFREAVLFAHQLGYQHVWIDSLCIIQDDDEDWKNEAQRMSLVYTKAVCVIEAMDGVGFDGGLMGDRTSPENIGNINTRGWVLQEQMMPPRSLKLTNGTVIWECREYDASETAPIMVKRPGFQGDSQRPMHIKDIFSFFRDTQPAAEGRPSEAASLTTPSQPDEQHSGATPPRPEDDPNQTGTFHKLYDGITRPEGNVTPFMRAWWQFVSLFTKRHLTNQSDKFLAINGITSIAQRWTHHRNTFGLWYYYLEKELCWYVDPAEAPGSRPSTWLGPTWSWINTCNGTVRNDAYDRLSTKSFLYMKPQIRMSSGTSFDMDLPFKAFTDPKHHSIELQGNMRKATVTTTEGPDGKPHHDLVVESKGRFSDHERLDFRPDCAHEFPVGSSVGVYCFHVWHLEGSQAGEAQSTDVYIMVKQVHGERALTLTEQERSKEELLEERRMRRLGYMEATYRPDQMRRGEDIHEDAWWWWIRLE